jgi:HEAT repeat protein
MKKNIEKLKEKKDIKRLIKALKDQNWGYAQSAAEALCEFGDSRAIEPVLHYLRDRGFQSQYVLINALNKNEELSVQEKEYSDVANVLIAACHKDEEAHVRNVAVKIIAKIGKPMISFLLQGMKDDPQGLYPIRYAFEEMGESAIDGLIPLLKDKTPQMRKLAVGVLGEIGNPQVVEALIQALDDEDPSVRGAACHHLIKLKIPGIKDKLLEVIIADAKHENWIVRDASIGKLGRIADERAKEAIKEAWANEKEEVVREKIWMVMNNLNIDPNE